MAVTNTFTDQIITSYKGNGATVSAVTGTYTGTRDAGVAAVVAANATNQEIDVAFPHASLVSLIIQCDVDITLKTNVATNPGDTITVKKTAPVVWGSDYQSACPFTADVTKFFLTSTDVNPGKFNFRALYA